MQYDLRYRCATQLSFLLCFFFLLLLLFFWFARLDSTLLFATPVCMISNWHLHIFLFQGLLVCRLKIVHVLWWQRNLRLLTLKNVEVVVPIHSSARWSPWWLNRVWWLKRSTHQLYSTPVLYSKLGAMEVFFKIIFMAKAAHPAWYGYVCFSHQRTPVMSEVIMQLFSCTVPFFFSDVRSQQEKWSESLLIPNTHWPINKHFIMSQVQDFHITKRTRYTLYKLSGIK